MAKTNSISNALNKVTGSIMDAANLAASNTPSNTAYADLYDTFRSNYPSYSTTSSYSGGGPGMVDISNILAAYEQGAESNRVAAKSAYDTRRSDLLTSLKRFQDENAKDVANQQKAYLSSQASLESAVAQADRQNRINAAARGLGGSGLQQLSQLQNLLSQGQTISDMATENQTAMDKLRTLLANREEDTNTELGNLLTNYNNTISSINSELAQNKANIEYQAREAAASRAASASSIANALSQQMAEYDTQANTDAKAFNAELSKVQKDLKTALSKAKSTNERKTAIDEANSTLSTLLANYSISASDKAYNNSYNSLNSIYTDKKYVSKDAMEAYLKNKYLYNTWTPGAVSNYFKYLKNANTNDYSNWLSDYVTNYQKANKY